MGNQQKSLMALAIISTAIAILVGIKIYKSAEADVSQRALTNDLLYIARRAQEYYYRIEFFGGGGHSFKGLNEADGVKKLYGSSKNENGTFQIINSGNDQMLIIQAVGTHDSDGDGENLTIQVIAYPDSLNVKVLKF